MLRRSVNLCGRLPRKRHFSTESQRPRVAIVGSGPAGFYTAQQILKSHATATVDIYERLPVPFGLVRFGVAPDHPEVKNVVNTFTATALNERCAFVGNVDVGRDITVGDLQRAYTAVVLAYGADDDKTLGIPGEDLDGVLSARSFVGWYNGLPQYSNLRVDLTRTDTAVVLGQGNVALDVARVLLTPIDLLMRTDISAHAVAALSESRVRRVCLVGRRGPLQVAFTIAELREMLRLPSCRSVFAARDFDGLQQYVSEIPRSRRRLTELMINAAATTQPLDGAAVGDRRDRSWQLKFLRSPLRFLASESDSTRLGCIHLAVNKLQGEVGHGQKAVPTGKTEDMQCGLVLRSIGYKSISIDPEVPFDQKNGIIPNDQGRVHDHPGLYCSGWVKRGPVGVIATTMNDAFETARIVVDDLSSGQLSTARDQGGRREVEQLLTDRGVTCVSFADWQKIDLAEVSAGQAMGKLREKMVVIDDMLKVATA